LTRSIGAAAVFETAAETPPTVIAKSVLVSVKSSPGATDPSVSVVLDGDNDRNVLEEVDILKKSITKGGLSKEMSAGCP
jgi:hypothetical protein